MTAAAAPRPSVEVITFGCRLNGVESEAMQIAAEAAALSDLVIVNTCAVTAEAVRQARQTIRRIRRDRPQARIVVTGCAAEVDPAGFAATSEIAEIIGNDRKTQDATWHGLAQGGGAAPVTADGRPASRQIHTRAFVEVQNGCDHRCTFCIIPYGRGASRSVPISEVVARIRRRVGAGAREAVLTGVDITAYGADLTGAPRLGQLVRTILREVPELDRLRLSSIDCIEADPALRAAIAEEPRLMPHLHLSLQSGDDLILKRMKRRHSRADAIGFCAEIRRLRPEIVFGADFIVGFPTETKAMFKSSLALIEECGLTHLHVFPFSPRPGTPAARMPQVAGEAVKERAKRLRDAGEQALAGHLARQVGRILEVLSESGGRARAPDFTSVRVGNVARGELLHVLISGHDGRELSGEPVAAQAAQIRLVASAARPHDASASA
jgi:threonylcarbamoyladenosine tRNA methylthiotransferase MtaB